MKTQLLSISLVFFLLASCLSERDQAVRTIKQIEEELSSDTLSVLDRTVALDLIKLYADFSSNYPNDSLAPRYLFKAGEISMNLNMGQQAINYFSQFLNEFPEDERRPEAIFLQAYVFENQLQNYDKARQLYQSFIDQYPDHDLYKDAKASLKNMGRPLEEIIKEFEEKALKEQQADGE